MYPTYADHIFRFQQLGERLAATAGRVAQLNPNDMLLNECLFQCETYRFYSELGFTVQVETPFQRWELRGGHQRKCDLRLDSTTWLELKAPSCTRHGHGFLNADFGHLLEGFVRDLNRLNTLVAPNHTKIGLLTGLFDFEDEEERENIMRIQPGDPLGGGGVLNLVFHHPPLRWRRFDLYMTIGIWVWEGQLPEPFAPVNEGHEIGQV